jgi:hypothetical protein
MTRTNKYKTKHFLWLLLIPVLLLCFSILSCGQDSLFFDISNEPEPKDPRIPGSPTNIVVIRNQLFVGSRMGGGISRYASAGGNMEWHNIPTPGGSLGDIATDGEYLYALLFPTGNPLNASLIRRYNVDTNIWDLQLSIATHSIQTIFGAEGVLFAGAMLNDDHQNFSLLYLDPNTFSLTVMRSNTTLLTGAAMDRTGNIYLATAGCGIFRYSNGTIETQPESGTENANISGIISTGSTIVGVSSDGIVYCQDAAGIFLRFSTGINFTGALSLWANRANQWRPTLLLMGIRSMGSSLNQGYREMELDRNGFPILAIRVPGDESPSSVTSRARYAASIGIHPVETILQIPDGTVLNYGAFTGDPNWEPPIFAGTSRSGLWSFRNGEWNAED